MLPATNDRTLSRYLLSAAHTIRQQIAAGLGDDAVARLGETAAVIARVAQQIDGRDGQAEDARGEFEAILTAEAELAALTDAGEDGHFPAGARSVDRDRSQSYLRAHPLGGPHTHVSAARLLAGGRCKITALIEQTGAVALPSSLILRQDWDGGATDTTVAGEFALLERLYMHGVRVPRPLLVETDPQALGSPFIMVERIPGRVEGGLYNPPRSVPLMLQLAEQLGRIHAMPLTEVEPLLGTVREDAGARAVELKSFADGHMRFGLLSKIVDAAIAWLAANEDLAGDTLSLVHNDFGFHNVLVDGDRLTAILDWELAKIAHPASDLGYIKHFVDKVMPWDEFIAHYVASGGFRIPEETIRYHAVWNAVRLYGLIMVARHNLEIGRVNDMEITYACADNVMLLIAFLGREIFATRTDAAPAPATA